MILQEEMGMNFVIDRFNMNWSGYFRNNISLSVPPSDPYKITRNWHMVVTAPRRKNVVLGNVNSGGLPCNMGKFVQVGTKKIVSFF